jgi:hypothetical protein
MEDDLDDTVNDIISQLKGGNELAKTSPSTASVDKETLENFIIQNSGDLIVKSLGIIDEVKDYISSAPEARDVTAFAELLKAASSSIDTLNKVYVSIERNKTSKDIKQMDVESKEKINSEQNVTYLLSRKEIMKELMSDSSEVQVETTTDDAIDI